MTQSSTSPEKSNFQDVIDRDEDLALFLKKMKEFDTAFCTEMIKRSDFTLRLEVHGNVGSILHVRVYQDSIDRPPGAQRRIDGKRGK